MQEEKAREEQAAKFGAELIQEEERGKQGTPKKKKKKKVRSFFP